MINVLDAGAKGDGSTDDTAALQTAMQSNDVVYLPKGHYVISQTISVSGLASLRGDGVGLTSIDWKGPINSAPMLQQYGPYGISWSGLRINGNGRAKNCAVITAARSCSFENLIMSRASDTMLVLVPTNLSNFMMNTFSNIYLTADGENIPGVTALQIGTSAPGLNCCHNTFIGLELEHGHTGINIGNADNNSFLMIYAHRRAEATAPAYEVDFSAGALSRSNYLFHCQGQVHATAGSRNVVSMYDRENGELPPVLDSGANLEWREASNNSTGDHIQHPIYGLSSQIGGGDWIPSFNYLPENYAFKIWRNDNGQMFVLTHNNQTRRAEIWVSPDGSPPQKILSMSGKQLGFFGVVGVPQPLVQGTTDSDLLHSLIAALTGLGLIKQ